MGQVLDKALDGGLGMGKVLHIPLDKALVMVTETVVVMDTVVVPDGVTMKVAAVTGTRGVAEAMVTAMGMVAVIGMAQGKGLGGGERKQAMAKKEWIRLTKEEWKKLDEEEKNYKPKPHRPKAVKFMPWPVCSRCGLVYLRNAATKAQIHKGC